MVPMFGLASRTLFRHAEVYLYIDAQPTSECTFRNEPSTIEIKPIVNYRSYWLGGNLF